MRNSEYQAVNIKNDIPELVHELTVFSDTYPIRILGAQAVKSDFEAFRLSAVIENIHTAQELVSEIRAHKYDGNKFSSRILSAINKKQQMNLNL